MGRVGQGQDPGIFRGELLDGPPVGQPVRRSGELLLELGDDVGRLTVGVVEVGEADRLGPLTERLHVGIEATHS